MKLVVIVIAVSIIATASTQKFNCPAKDGLYEDSLQCDKYFECNDGISTPQLCPDGLVFNPRPASRRASQCDQPFNVDCGERTELQPAQPTKLCPRQNGFFSHPDETICHIFYNCIRGEANQMECTSGLYFDEIYGNCVWPNLTDRKDCVNTAIRKLKDGFECPAESQTDANGLAIVHPKFPNKNDCQLFYVCINGNEPRSLGCTSGEVYNEETQKCDAPENVRGCEDWYKDEEPVNPKAPASTRQLA